MKYFFFLFSLLCTINLSAQDSKFGHVNRGNLIFSLPEALEADSLLVLYRDSILTFGEGKAKIFQEEYEALVKDVQSGNLTRIQQEEREKALTVKQQELVKLEEDAGVEMEKRRALLFQPIAERIDNAIKKVGKEGNYLFIFDTSIYNAMLFADESVDVTEKVKAAMQ